MASYRESVAGGLHGVRRELRGEAADGVESRGRASHS